MTKSPIIVDAARIYIDANVLINFCTGQTKDCAELKNLFSHKPKSSLYTSNLAIVQTIAKLQTKTKNRDIMPQKDIIKYINYFFAHITVCEVSNTTLKKALNMPAGDDLEDNVHFQICKSVKCNTVLTNNRKDFLPFPVFVLVPGKFKYEKRN